MSCRRAEMDEHYMRHALELAERGIGRAAPNPLVGAVIVKDGRIVGEGWHEEFGGAHAEVNAVRSALKSLEGSEVYVTLEPCCHYGKTPPCTDLLIEKRVKRVVVGVRDPDPRVSGGGIRKLREAGIEVKLGILERECARLNEVFFHYTRTRRPFVVMKSAVSLDGKIAAPSGESKWITSEVARKDSHYLRNRYSAIMVGVETVIRDDPELTCRLEGGRNPKRIILDSRLRTPPESRVLKNPAENPVLIACTEEAGPEAARRLEAMGAELLYCESRDGRVDLSDLMGRLGGRSVDSILLEGGGTVNESAIVQGIVSKVILYVAPKIIGGERSKSAVGGQGILRLEQAFPLRFESAERIGEDLKIIAYRKEERDVYGDH
jgi:diaminohydroxyphosphoribosylaminopyrimidine deaminase/5-amino-6-(5-phosphoribosylamino)uracil reductase